MSNLITELKRREFAPISYIWFLRNLSHEDRWKLRSNFTVGDKCYIPVLLQCHGSVNEFLPLLVNPPATFYEVKKDCSYQYNYQSETDNYKRKFLNTKEFPDDYEIVEKKFLIPKGSEYTQLTIQKYDDRITNDRITNDFAYTLFKSNGPSLPNNLQEVCFHTFLFWLEFQYLVCAAPEISTGTLGQWLQEDYQHRNEIMTRKLRDLPAETEFIKDLLRDYLSQVKKERRKFLDSDRSAIMTTMKLVCHFKPEHKDFIVETFETLLKKRKDWVWEVSLD